MLRLASPAYHASPAMWLNTMRGSRRTLLAPNALSAAAGVARPRPQQQQTALIAWSAAAPFHSTRLVRLDAERQSPTTSAEHGPPPPPSSSSPGLRASGARRRDASSPRPTTTTSPQPTTTSTTSTTPFEPRTPSKPVQNPLAAPPADARVPRRRITSVNELPKSFGRNQMIKVPEQIQRDLEDVMSSFKAPIRYAFAYGSGVFQQKGYTNEVRSAVCVLPKTSESYMCLPDAEYDHRTHRTNRCSTLSLPSRTLPTGTRSTCSNIRTTTLSRCDYSARTPSRGCKKRGLGQKCGSTLTSRSTAR